MNNYGLYLINGNNRDYIQIKTKPHCKITQIRINTDIIGNTEHTKIKIETESDPRIDYLNQKIQAKFAKLPPCDKKGLIESGIITDEDLE
jgi:hypothetical protein